jgi:hypothetical protein
MFSDMLLGLGQAESFASQLGMLLRVGKREEFTTNKHELYEYHE